tara:strand:- start:8208 stop:8528 length:321 start_codon:yes stop_codon:yes gene_type:complete
MAWKEMSRYRAGAPDGGTEEFVLEKDENGNFRVRNDFGNTVFEFERMSGYEFLRKISRDVENDLEDELNELWNNTGFDDDNCDGFDGNPYNSVSGADIDSNGYGAD